MDGARAARLHSPDEVRTWIAAYRGEHAEDDPDAAHIQIVQRGPLGLISGGKLVDREQFL